MTKEQKLLASLYELQENNNNKELSKALDRLVKALEYEIQNKQLIPLV